MLGKVAYEGYNGSVELRCRSGLASGLAGPNRPAKGTVRLLTRVLCKPTLFVFQILIATMYNSLQTSFNRALKGCSD